MFLRVNWGTGKIFKAAVRDKFIFFYPLEIYILIGFVVVVTRLQQNSCRCGCFQLTTHFPSYFKRSNLYVLLQRIECLYYEMTHNKTKPFNKLLSLLAFSFRYRFRTDLTMPFCLRVKQNKVILCGIVLFITRQYIINLLPEQQQLLGCVDMTFVSRFWAI